MSNSIDRRVVEMEFDNQQFEKGIKTSLHSLDSLKKGLDLEKSVKSLSGLEKAGRTFSLAGIADSVGVISNRFSAMGIIGVTALQNITNAAINTSKKMIAALTIDPLKMGFSEYETQINSVQTILANTSAEMDKAGYTQQQRLDIVNGKLDELNTYADKTIYNFTEMTRNIGTFTAAGVDLDKSVSSIKGIANLAAVSGSTSQQASTAMYQLSQAISTGTVRLMDWNSVVNAGMGGELFQNALIRTAKNMGVVGEEAKEAFAELEAGKLSFRDSLSSGWLSSDILTETLSQLAMDFEAIAEAQGITVEAAKELKKAELLAEGYTGAQADEIIALAETASEAATKVKTFTQLFDTMKEAIQSGWTQSWEIIVGDFEESKALLTSISDYFGEIIGKSAESRNAMLSVWDAKGGRQELIDGFWALIRAMENVSNSAKEAFAGLFPKMTGEKLYGITKTFSDFADKVESFTQNSESMGKVSRVFNGIVSALGIVKDVASVAWNGFKSLGKSILPAGEGLLDFVAGVGDYFVALRSSLKLSDRFSGAIEKISAIAQSGINFVKGIGSALGDIFDKAKAKGAEKLGQIGDGLIAFLGKIPQGIDKLREYGIAAIEYLKTNERIKNGVSKVKNFFAPWIDHITSFATTMKDALKAFFDKDTSGLEGFGDKLKARLSAVREAFSGWFDNVREGAGESWTKIKNFFVNFFTKSIPDFFQSLSNKANSVLARFSGIDWAGILKGVYGIMGAVNLMKFLTSFNRISKGFKSIGKGLKNLGNSIKDVVKNGINITKQNKDSLGNTLLKMAGAIGILVASIVVLAKMDDGEIVKGLGVLGILAMELLAVSALFKKFGPNDGKGFLMLGAALALMVVPIKLLGSMDTDTALKGVVGIGLIMAELALFMRLAGDGFKNKTAFLSMSIAINLLVLAVKSLGDMSIGGAIKGLVGLGTIFLLLGSFMKKTGNLRKTSGLIGMSIAINLIAVAVRSLGKLKGATLTKGLAAITAILLGFGAFAKATQGANFGSTILMFASMAASMFIFIEAFKKIEGMDTDSMLKFSVSLSAILLALSASMKLLSNVPITGSLTAIANLAIAIVGVGGIIVALGWLQDQWSGMTGFLEAGGNVLGSIGSAIGKFVGGIVGGVGAGISSNMPQIGTDLTVFMTNVQGFIDGARGVDETAKTGVKNLSDALLSIAWAEIVTGLANAFSDGDAVGKFSDDIAKLGQGLVKYAFYASLFGSVSKTKLDNSVAIAKSLSEVVKNLPSTTGISAWVDGVGDANKFSTDIGVIAGALNTFITEISSIKDEDFNEAKVEAATKVAEGLTALENSLAPEGGALQDFTGIKSLESFGDRLPEFATFLNEFITQISTLDKNSYDQTKIDNAIKVAEGLVKLENSLGSEGGSLQDFTGIKSLESFGDRLPEFAKFLNEFITQISTLDKNSYDQAKIDNAIKVAEGLVKLENSLTAEGGSWQNFIGIKSLESFGKKLPGFASGLNGFITEVSKLDKDSYDQTKIDNAIAVAQAIRDFESTLTATDGIWQDIVGTQDMGLFSTNVKSIGEALASFATNIGGVDVAKSENAVTVMNLIKDFTEGLDETGGLWDNIGKWFGGDQANTLLNYTKNMKTLGQDLNSFATDISTVKVDDVNQASGIFSVISTFIEGLKKDGGLWSDIGEFFGGSKENELVNSTKNLATAGANLKSFSDSVSGIDSSSITTFMDSFAGIVERMTGVEDVYDLSDYIKWLGSDIKAFYKDVKDVDFTNSATITSFVNGIADAAIKLENVSGTDGNIFSQLPAALDTLLTAVSGKEESFKTTGAVLGSALTSALISEVQNGNDGMTAAASNISTAGSSAIRSTYISWYTAGQHIGNGLVSGLASRENTIISAARRAAMNAFTAAKRALDINSPSGMFEWIGMQSDYGFAGGLDRYSKVVALSAKDVANSAVNSAKAMLTGFTSTVTDGIDTTPTIRPVLDLTNVTNGVHMLNGMFNANRSMNASVFAGTLFGRNASNLAFDGNRIVGSTNNKDVVAAINDLSDRFNNLSEAVRNINLVLDTGALVGQLDTKIDSQLGVLAGRRERGN